MPSEITQTEQKREEEIVETVFKSRMYADC